VRSLYRYSSDAFAPAQRLSPTRLPWNETAVTIEQGAAAQVKIRSPGPRWLPGFVLAGLCLPFVASSITTGD